MPVTTLQIITTLASAAIGALVTPLTLFVLYRWGLVGGTPREMLKAQLDLEAKKLEVESKKLAIGDEELKLRSRKQELDMELRREQMRVEAVRHAPRQFNPNRGLAGFAPPPPPSKGG